MKRVARVLDPRQISGQIEVTAWDEDMCSPSLDGPCCSHAPARRYRLGHTDLGAGPRRIDVAHPVMLRGITHGLEHQSPIRPRVAGTARKPSKAFRVNTEGVDRTGSGSKPTPLPIVVLEETDIERPVTTVLRDYVHDGMLAAHADCIGALSRAPAWST